MSGGAGFPRAGHLVKSWCRAAGARDEQITSTTGTWCWSTREERGAWGGSSMVRVTESEYATNALKLGIVTKREELDELKQAWARWNEDDDAWFGVLHGKALVKKV